MKVCIKVGDVEIDYEGGEPFLLKHVPDLVDLLRNKQAHNVPKGGHNQEPAFDGRASNGTLASYLAACGAKTNKTRKFLATALYLQDRGKQELKTSDVSNALTEAHQGGLGNASQCLSSNVGKGVCEKKGRGFYVTDEGRESLK